MKTKLLITSSIIGIIVCFLFGLHVWAISQIGQNYDSNQNNFGNVQNDLIKNQQLNNLKRSLKNAGQEKDALLALFINNDDIPNFIQSIETVMQNLKINGTTKSVSERSLPELTAASKDELVVSFEAEATYPKLMQLVEILENLPYKSYLSQVNLTKEDLSQTSSTNVKSTVTGLWKLSLTLNVVKNVVPKQ